MLGKYTLLSKVAPTLCVDAVVRAGSHDRVTSALAYSTSRDCYYGCYWCYSCYCCMHVLRILTCIHPPHASYPPAIDSLLPAAPVSPCPACVSRGQGKRVRSLRCCPQAMDRRRLARAKSIPPSQSLFLWLDDTEKSCPHE